ncbi:hypothetical protein XELAEV_18023981mg [Xenopus laevis]|uniref:Uncharacterized protein n=1 Tax=Xenopus laevis TaxID=8355 RepID=A0A974D7X9_XENLA|nr:hypothetical protein XELAEV_18023981mg [Xenopus laevis]
MQFAILFVAAAPQFVPDTVAISGARALLVREHRYKPVQMASMMQAISNEKSVPRFLYSRKCRERISV